MYAEERNPLPYTIHSKEIALFPVHIANHIAKHLAQKIVLDNGIKTNYEDDYKKAYDLITHINL